MAKNLVLGPILTLLSQIWAAKFFFKNLVSGPILAQIWAQKTFSWVLPLLDIIHCCKLSLHAISRTTNGQNLGKWQKT